MTEGRAGGGTGTKVMLEAATVGGALGGVVDAAGACEGAIRVEVAGWTHVVAHGLRSAELYSKRCARREAGMDLAK